jgi:tRNA A-37 threonylcarbamoyl transferase component Bud32
LASNGSRKVLRIGANVVVKFGPKVILAEAEAVMYIRNNTTIPVPKILDAYSKDGSNYIIMEYLDGDLLKEVWQHMPKAERSIIVSELRDYIC